MRRFLAALVLIIILVVVSGCLDSLMGKPSNIPPATTVPTTEPTPENPSATLPVSSIALQLTDLPSDYILRDRSVMIPSEVPQITRDLGWREGYFVSFYHTNEDEDDLTKIRQSISILSLENMKQAFDLEKEDMASQAVSPVTVEEMPFPATGSHSIAYRQTDPTDSMRVVTYTVIFTKKNVYETITMTGTTTDYELLKDVVAKAAAKIT